MNLRPLARSALYLACFALFITVSLAAQAKGPKKKVVTVAADGSGQFRTVQEAVDSAPGGNIRIDIKPGEYRALVNVSANGVELHGLGKQAQDTVLIYDNAALTPGPDGRQLGTGRSATVMVTGDDFVAENLTMANDFEKRHARTEMTSQAVALHITGDREVFRHVRFLGFQDTLYADSKLCHTQPQPTGTASDRPAQPTGDAAATCYAARDYFADCYVEGHVDFIFGDARAVFDRCEIHVLPHSMDTITAQSRLRPSEVSGYVFRDCVVTADPANLGATPDILLGRPWRDYSTVIFINTRFDAPLDPAAWKEWGGRLKTSTYEEYNSHGQAGEISRRIAPSKQLTRADLTPYSTKTFLAAPDNWDPARLK